MPVYCYRRIDNGEAVELFMSREEMNLRQFGDGLITLEDGAVAERDFRAEFGHIPTLPGNWPMTSASAGVCPSQVKEAEAYSRQVGVPTHFTKHGDAIFTSPSHRRRYLRAHGLFDRNAGYSDPAPIHARS